MTHGLQEGDRVRLTQVVERYPHFVVEAGTVGTVTYTDDAVLGVTLDDKIDGAEEWSNEIMWYEGMVGQDFAAAARELERIDAGCPQSTN